MSEFQNAMQAMVDAKEHRRSEQEMAVRLDCLKISASWHENKCVADIVSGASRMAEFVAGGRVKEPIRVDTLTPEPGSPIYEEDNQATDKIADIVLDLSNFPQEGIRMHCLMLAMQGREGWSTEVIMSEADKLMSYIINGK